MTQPFPATYTIPSPSQVREQLLSDYPIGTPIDCRLFMSSINDVYRVQTESRRYILKIYRAGWRSPDEVLYELDFLAHLRRAGVSVSLPVARCNGERIYPLPALEGIRPCVLFTYAPGRQPTWPFYREEVESRLLGKILASIHQAGDDFSSPHPRFRHDAARLLDETLTEAQPFLAHRAADWEYLQGLAEQLRARLDELVMRGLTWGICHGDFHCGNLFLSEDGTATVFDFDVCGPGWLAFDLARWKANAEGQAGNSWAAFLEGYQERRGLNAADQEAVPLFVLLRMLDWMRIKSSFTTAGAWGYWDMDFYFDATLRALKELQDRALG